MRAKMDLDEEANAYNDIHKVMANQKNLVDIAVNFMPLAVMKG